MLCGGELVPVGRDDLRGRGSSGSTKLARNDLPAGPPGAALVLDEGLVASSAAAASSSFSSFEVDFGHGIGEDKGVTVEIEMIYVGHK